MTNVYIGNKMADVPYMNAPWFDEAEEQLLTMPDINLIFNPARHDREMGFEPMKCPNGTREEAAAHGFDIRAALRYDWNWIAQNSDLMVVGERWRTSRGTKSEIACHLALGLPIYGYKDFLRGWSQRHIGIGPLPLKFDLEDLGYAGYRG